MVWEQLTLFRQLGPKPPTRYKAEIVDERGCVDWEILVHDEPSPRLRRAIEQAGFRVQRASTPTTLRVPALVYSERDPVESIRAAQEHAARRETQIGNVLMLLIARAGQWVTKDELRQVGGDSGDRRWREIRAHNWPVEIRQRGIGQTWAVRLVLPDLSGRQPEGENPCTEG